MIRAKAIQARVLLAATILAFSSISAFAQARPDAKEGLLRKAYDKLTFYNQAANAEFAAQRKTLYKAEDDLRFDLRILRAGPVQELYNIPIGELVTKPTGEIMRIGRHIKTSNQGPEFVMFEARWATNGYAGSLLEDWEHTTMEEALRLIGEAEATGYISYEVTAHLAGKERTYRALALYHDSLQSGVEPKINFFDNIVGQGSLINAVTEKRPPVKAPWSEYVKSDEYRIYVEKHKKANQRENEPEFEMYLNKLPESDLPEPPPDYCEPHTSYGIPQGKFKVDYAYHSPLPFYGQHDVRTGLEGQCFTDSNCRVACTVSLTNLEMNETGFQSSACHQSGWDVLYEDSTGVVNQSINCATTIGAAFKACVFCHCNVSIQITGTTVTSDGFWTVRHKLSHMCCNGS